MLYYADRISDNIHKREPEGYLICVNVPIARTGTQQYLQDEIGQSGDKAVTVYRPEEEVFSKATMASFEGMPVTNDHPDAEEGVTVDNVQYLSKGHCQNVRRGTGKDKDLLIADLIITDEQTIREVLDGKREISCGYNYELHEEDGKMVQREIRGNHIAIVDKGRAGHRVSIKDSAPNNERSKNRMKKPSGNGHVGILAKMLATFARDEATTPDELEQAVDAVEEMTAEEIVPPDPENVEDEDPMAAIMARLDALEQKVGTDEKPEDDPLARLEQDLDELEGGKPEAAAEEKEIVAPDEDPEEPASQFVPPEDINGEDAEEEFFVEGEEEEPAEDCGPGKDCGNFGHAGRPGKKGADSARIALNAIRPIIASLPPSQRKAAADKAVAAIRKASGLNAKPTRNGYTALMRRKASDSNTSDPAKIGESIMAKRNPHYKNK